MALRDHGRARREAVLRPPGPAEGLLNRTAWLFLVLLVATNLAWVVLRSPDVRAPGPAAPPAREAADPAARAEIARLASEVRRLEGELAKASGGAWRRRHDDRRPAGARRI